MPDDEKQTLLAFMEWLSEQDDLTLLGTDPDGYRTELGQSDREGYVDDYLDALRNGPTVEAVLEGIRQGEGQS